MFRPFLFIAVLLSATIAVNHLTARRVPETLAMPLDQIDSQLLDWRVTNTQQLGASDLKALAPTAYLARTYQKGNNQLDLFIAFYAQQRAGESMHSPKHCLPGSGWEIWRLGRTLIPVDGRQVAINQYSIENAGARRLMMYWYQSKNEIIASEYIGKLLLARDALFTGRTGGSIVRIILPDTPEAATEGSAFAAIIAAKVQNCLGK
jgi:EpsI family protein